MGVNMLSVDFCFCDRKCSLHVGLIVLVIEGVVRECHGMTLTHLTLNLVVVPACPPTHAGSIVNGCVGVVDGLTIACGVAQFFLCWLVLPWIWSIWWGVIIMAKGNGIVLCC